VHPSWHRARVPDATPLERAIRDCRRRWRWHYGRFWLLRWENRFHRPAWRLAAEDEAWRAMRAEVRHYAALRRQLAVGQPA
jgi:hypothetical protein